MTLAEKVRILEKRQKVSERDKETKKEVKKYKFPFKWNRKFSQSNKKRFNEQMLVIFLNKKNQIEQPRFMPIFDGNMIVWKNKPYEFDPRAVWRMQAKKNPQVYLIKEIDRRPVSNNKGEIIYRDAAVSNLDINEIRERGDSTESDEFLIKAALKAQTALARKNVNMIAVVVLIVLAVGGVIWFMTSGSVT